MNNFDQFGFKSSNVSSDPTKSVPVKISFYNANINQVICGSYSVVCLASDYKVYVWGRNRDYQLGINGGSKKCLTPQENLFFREKQIISVKVGDAHSMFLSLIGELYVAGNNKYGQLGIEDLDLDTHPVHKLNFLPGIIEKISCGANHSAILTNAGDLYMCGNCRYRQLGPDNYSVHISDGYIVTSRKTFKKFENVQSINTVMCGKYQTIVVTNTNDTFVWGGYDVLVGDYDPRKNLPIKLFSPK